MKVEENQNPFFYSWLPTGPHHKTLAIWIFFLCILANLGHFFSWKVFWIVDIIFFKSKFGEIFTQKRTPKSVGTYICVYSLAMARVNQHPCWYQCCEGILFLIYPRIRVYIFQFIYPVGKGIWFKKSFSLRSR